MMTSVSGFFKRASGQSFVDFTQGPPLVNDLGLGLGSSDDVQNAPPPKRARQTRPVLSQHGALASPLGGIPEDLIGHMGSAAVGSAVAVSSSAVPPRRNSVADQIPFYGMETSIADVRRCVNGITPNSLPEIMLINSALSSFHRFGTRLTDLDIYKAILNAVGPVQDMNACCEGIMSVQQGGVDSRVKQDVNDILKALDTLTQRISARIKSQIPAPLASHAPVVASSQSFQNTDPNDLIVSGQSLRHLFDQLTALRNDPQRLSRLQDGLKTLKTIYHSSRDPNKHRFAYAIGAFSSLDNHSVQLFLKEIMAVSHSKESLNQVQLNLLKQFVKELAQTIQFKACDPDPKQQPAAQASHDSSALATQPVVDNIPVKELFDILEAKKEEIKASFFKSPNSTVSVLAIVKVLFKHAPPDASFKQKDRSKLGNQVSDLFYTHSNGDKDGSPSVQVFGKAFFTLGLEILKGPKNPPLKETDSFYTLRKYYLKQDLD